MLQNAAFRFASRQYNPAIKAGAITVNEKDVKPNYKVKPNDVIKAILPRRFEGKKKIIPQNIPLDIRYEDDHILILHKPPGMVVHPGVGHRPRLRPEVGAHDQSHRQMGQQTQPKLEPY